MTNMTTTPKRQRHTVRELHAAQPADLQQDDCEQDPASRDRSFSKLDQIEALLLRDTGASIAEMVEATGWQKHSVRGAIAGALRKRGLTITSDKIDSVRRYRVGDPA